MMQLIAIDEPTVIDINEKMSTLGEALETNNLTLDTVNCSNTVSQNVNTTSFVNINIKNETVNEMNASNVNINGIIKINGTDKDDKIDKDQTVDEDKSETITTNGNLVPDVDCKISADDINTADKILEDKEEVILENDPKVSEIKNCVDKESSQIHEIYEKVTNGENTNVNILKEDDANTNKNSDFSPNSDKETNLSSQLQQLENSTFIGYDESPKSSKTEEINTQETTSEDTLNLVEVNKAYLHLKETNDVTNETEQIVLPCRDNTKIDAKNNGESKVSTEKESIVDDVLGDATVISDEISLKVEHVCIDSVDEVSNLPHEEIVVHNIQTETMDVDDEEACPPSKNNPEQHTENNTISEDEIFEEARIISDQNIIDKKYEEEALNLPLEETIEETYQKEVKDIDAAKKINNGKKLDENDEIHKIQVMDVDDIEVRTLEEQPKVAKIMPDTHDSIENGDEDKNISDKDLKKADPNKETTDANSKIPTEDVKIIENDNTVIDIDVAKELSAEKSTSHTDDSTNEIDTETKTDEALAVDNQRKAIIDMDINDVEEFPTVDSTLASDVNTKEINSETKTAEEVVTEQDPVVRQTDENETNVLKSENENSEVISIDESENDVSHNKPVISFCSVTPVEIKEKPSPLIPEKKLPVVCKLSNTMDILSDDEEPPAKPIELKKEKVNEEPKMAEENKCINLDDDDDIMFIDDTNTEEPKLEQNKAQLNPEGDKTTSDTDENSTVKAEKDVPDIIEEGNSTTDEAAGQPKEDVPISTKPSEEPKSILTKTFLQSVTKNLANMTRNELEDFCILKLVESVVDKSNLNEIKSKMKTMTQTLEDLRKKTVALTKQNRDLQVVVKTVQEDQKKRNTNPMMPMKITRSVGMQVVLTGEKSLQKRKSTLPTQPPPPMTPARPARTSQSPKIQLKTQANIPVPRLVPASSPTLKSPATAATNAKVTVKNTTPQRPEKRPHNKTTSPSPATSSVTVDLTDDEPPSKIITKNPTPPVRLVPSQNLMPKNRPQFTPNTSNNSARESPRKVYIPISSNNPRPPVGKNFALPPRSRPPVIHPSVIRMQTMRVNQVTTSNRHPAPLPDAMKQYQPPAWKALPPAPDLKLSKVDNGIVISWKFEGYQPDSYEEVASFQLYAYQETTSPPSTTLWKKIGDIKALPLPMACTLTQFMSGFKYYFAVRAIDVRSRIGPFSLPGSIMLISKN